MSYKTESFKTYSVKFPPISALPCCELLLFLLAAEQDTWQPQDFWDMQVYQPDCCSNAVYQHRLASMSQTYFFYRVFIFYYIFTGYLYFILFYRVFLQVFQTLKCLGRWQTSFGLCWSFLNIWNKACLTAQQGWLWSLAILKFYLKTLKTYSSVCEETSLC